MTEQDLLNILATKYSVIGIPFDDGNPEMGYQWKGVRVLDKDENSIRDSKVRYWVEIATGNAYWHPSEPKPAPAQGFQQEIATYIANKIIDNTIEGAFQETIDTANETAIYKVIMPNLTEKRIFVDKDSNGDLRYRELS